MLTANDNSLGSFLRSRRAKLDPAVFGFEAPRRRTPGLRREEVALRAGVSATWYTWLEQGRGGAPSADVLNQLAEALTLTPPEREHLFLLALHRTPEVRPDPVPETVSPQIQRVLDSMEFTPALIKTSTCDVLAWNHAATVVFTDYAKLAPAQRNLLRLLFCDPRARTRVAHWESHARLVVAMFRRETTRVGVSERAAVLVEELSRVSPEFAALWRDNDVGMDSEGIKQMEHFAGGPLTMEYSTFAVSDRPDLGMIVHTPVTPADRERIRALIADSRAC